MSSWASGIFILCFLEKLDFIAFTLHRKEWKYLLLNFHVQIFFLVCVCVCTVEWEVFNVHCLLD